MILAADTPIVYVLAEDAVARDALQALMRSIGLPVVAYAQMEHFAAAYAPQQPGCLVLDLGRQGRHGLEVQHELQRQVLDLPVIIIAEAADVPMAVSAMKNGALDFLERPYNEQLLLDCVQSALALDQGRRQALGYRRAAVDRFATLTPREREVMRMAVQGLANKDIARALAVSRKTVEVHRAKVMAKMGAESFSELVRMALIVGILENFADEDTADD